MTASSHVPGDIDELTPAWLAARIGPVASLRTTPIGSGFGLGGRTYLVEADTGRGEVDRIVAKFAGARPTAREIAFYEHCAPTTPLALPRFIGGAFDHVRDRGVVLTAHLPGVRQGDVLAGCSQEEAVSLVGMLARLHRRWWGGTDPALAAIATANEDGGGIAPRVRLGRAERALARHGDALDPNGWSLVTGLTAVLDDIHRALWAGPRTLIHRDFHLDNVLFVESGDPYVIDWQGAAVGPPEIDLARFLVEGMTPDQRHHHGDEVVGVYAASIDGDEVQLGTRIGLALACFLAGVVNWVGAPSPDPAGSRKAELGRNALASTLDALAAFPPRGHAGL